MPASQASYHGPLHGVRVVDFTHTIAGPMCTQLLADAGADVIKIEPRQGEFTRIRGPRRPGPNGTELSSYNAAVNRGKRSIVLDLKNQRGLDLAHRLIETADVIVENFSPGVLTRLGIDFAQLRARNPRLITVSISLYGGPETAGELAKRGGLAPVAEGEAGVTAMTRDSTGRPLMLGVPFGDTTTALASYAAITTALFAREKTGKGRHFDMSMVRTLMNLNACAITGAQIADAAVFDVRTAGYTTFATSDGYIALGVNSDHMFRRICEAMGRPDLAEDPRYAGYKVRDSHAAEVDAMIGDWSKTLTREEFVRVVSAVGVPCGKILSPEELVAASDARTLGFFQTIPDGLGGTIDTPSNPLGLERPGARLPDLAEHAEEILGEIGVSADELADLRDAGAFGTPPP